MACYMGLVSCNMLGLGHCSNIQKMFSLDGSNLLFASNI